MAESKRKNHSDLKPIRGEKEYDLLVKRARSLEKKSRSLEGDREGLINDIREWTKKYKARSETHRIVQSLEERPNQDLCFISASKLCVLESNTVKDANRNCVYRCISRPTG